MWMRCPSCASHEMPLTVCPIACAEAREALTPRAHAMLTVIRRTVMRGWYERADDGRYETLAYYLSATAGRATAERATAGRDVWRKGDCRNNDCGKGGSRS